MSNITDNLYKWFHYNYMVVSTVITDCVIATCNLKLNEVIKGDSRVHIVFVCLRVA